MPRPSSNRVRVRHTSGAEKNVLASRVDSLGPQWTRVSSTKKRPAAPADEPITPPAVEPDTDSLEG